MFIKNLTIEGKKGVVRSMEFRQGLNLIIDDTPASDEKKTGNNVGKTTVLKLIDYCFGAKASVIYADPENPKESYELVKKYLTDQEIVITLVLKEKLEDPDSREVEIKRNFLGGKKCIRTINGSAVLEKDFEKELFRELISGKEIEKPTFRQLISHNIRYRDESINHTLKTLHHFTSDAEYETLYLYLLGCEFDEGARKQCLLEKKSKEELFKKRLESKQTKSAYIMMLGVVEDEIAELNEKKHNLNLNADYEQDLNQLNKIRSQINKTSAVLGKLKIRRELIEDTVKELENSVSSIDMQQLRLLYYMAKMNVEGIQKNFEELVSYHNNMLEEKSRFISSDLPELSARIEKEERTLVGYRNQEKELAEKISKGDSFEDLENIITALNEKSRQQGEYESIISQIEEAEDNIKKINEELDGIGDELYSESFENKLLEQIKKFNKYFSAISNELYGEKYVLKHDKEISKTTKEPVYKFSAFNANLSSGKKQGEVLSFDLAYILFAEEDGIPCLHFLLNDKKELMHGNQLRTVSGFVQRKNIQLIASVLKDKMPADVLELAHVVVELSQEDKLFRIENME